MRRKMGNKPKTSMEKSVREKTCVVDGSHEASTADAMTAVFVENDAGRLDWVSRLSIGISIKARAYCDLLLVE